MIYLPFLAGLIGLVTLTGTQAVFAPADGIALKAAVASCLSETLDGSCPNVAASNVPGTNNPYGVIGDWDVSEVILMDMMFWNAFAFNGDISMWDTAKVADMDMMFLNALAFNGYLSKWNTAKVIDMSFMFADSLFNSDISKWDTRR